MHKAPAKNGLAQCASYLAERVRCQAVPGRVGIACSGKFASCLKFATPLANLFVVVRHCRLMFCAAEESRLPRLPRVTRAIMGPWSFSHPAEELIGADDVGGQRLVGHAVLEIGEPAGQTGGIGGAAEVLLVGG